MSRKTLHGEQINLLVFGKVAQAAFFGHELQRRLGYLAANLEVGLGAERRFAAGRYDLLGYADAQAVDGRKGRQDLALADGKARGVGTADVYVHKGITPQAHFYGQLQGRIQVHVDFRSALALGHNVLHGLPLPFQAVYHSRQLEGLGADRKEGRVIGQGIIDFKPGDAEGHHDVGYGVGSREEVADFVARIDEPLGNVAFLEFFFVIGRLLAQLVELVDALALTDVFHDLKARLGLDAVLNEIVHDVVTGRNGFLQLHRAGRDEVLGVVQPYVRTVGKAGYAHQFREGLGLGVDEHLADEGRAEFGNAQAADFGAQFFFRHA